MSAEIPLSKAMQIAIFSVDSSPVTGKVDGAGVTTILVCDGKPYIIFSNNGKRAKVPVYEPLSLDEAEKAVQKGLEYSSEYGGCTHDFHTGKKINVDFRLGAYNEFNEEGADLIPLLNENNVELVGSFVLSMNADRVEAQQHGRTRICVVIKVKKNHLDKLLYFESSMGPLLFNSLARSINSSVQSKQPFSPENSDLMMRLAVRSDIYHLLPGGSTDRLLNMIGGTPMERGELDDMLKSCENQSRLMSLENYLDYMAKHPDNASSAVDDIRCFAEAKLINPANASLFIETFRALADHFDKKITEKPKNAPKYKMWIADLQALEADAANIQSDGKGDDETTPME